MARAGGALALAAALCLLSACREEPDFDERYDAAEEKIRQKAKEIDSALTKAEREKAAGEAQGVADPATEVNRGPPTA